jgi:hypothetical protein
VNELLTRMLDGYEGHLARSQRNTVPSDRWRRLAIPNAGETDLGRDATMSWVLCSTGGLFSRGSAGRLSGEVDVMHVDQDFGREDHGQFRVRSVQTTLFTRIVGGRYITSFTGYLSPSNSLAAKQDLPGDTQRCFGKNKASYRLLAVFENLGLTLVPSMPM